MCPTSFPTRIPVHIVKDYNKQYENGSHDLQKLLKFVKGYGSQEEMRKCPEKSIKYAILKILKVFPSNSSRNLLRHVSQSCY